MSPTDPNHKLNQTLSSAIQTASEAANTLTDLLPYIFSALPSELQTQPHPQPQAPSPLYLQFIFGEPDIDASPVDPSAPHTTQASDSLTINFATPAFTISTTSLILAVLIVCFTAIAWTWMDTAHRTPRIPTTQNAESVQP